MSSFLYFASAEQSLVPSWIKNVAGFWSGNQISDQEFVNALQYMINQQIIKVPSSSTINFEDKGDFVVTYQSTGDPDFDELIPWLKDNEDLIISTDSLNEFYKLPYDIPIVFDKCGEINAYYSSDEGEIIMCYELVQHFIDLHSEVYSSDAELEQAVQDTLYFVFLHELGHALIDVYDLPTTGKEEDAVDQLATITLIAEGKQGYDALNSVAIWFYKEGVSDSLNNALDFSDEHSLNLQRFYNVLCLAYGENPEGNIDLVKSGFLSQDRANKCTSEYEKIANSWDTLLQPYVKP